MNWSRAFGLSIFALATSVASYGMLRIGWRPFVITPRQTARTSVLLVLVPVWLAMTLTAWTGTALALTAVELDQTAVMFLAVGAGVAVGYFAFRPLKVRYASEVARLEVRQ